MEPDMVGAALEWVRRTTARRHDMFNTDSLVTQAAAGLGAFLLSAVTLIFATAPFGLVG